MKTGLVIALAALIGLIPDQALALNNPSAVYCTALGYEYAVERNALGEAGFCVLPNGKKVDAWKFLLGAVEQDSNYCAVNGHSQKRVRASKTMANCAMYRTESCLVCVLADGTEVEVTELMRLDFDETTCGDGVCGVPETSESCPEDCRAAGCADLVVTKIDRPTWDGANDRSVIQATIQNVGDTVARATVARVIDPTTLQSTGAPFNAIAATPQLAPGASIVVTFYLPYWVYNPDVTLEVTADYKGDLEECNEDNNVEVFNDQG